MYDDLERPQNIGHLFGVLPIALFEDVAVYQQRMDKAIAEMRNARRRESIASICPVRGAQPAASQRTRHSDRPWGVGGTQRDGRPLRLAPDGFRAAPQATGMIDPTARVQLGRSGVEVCRLGFGSAPLGGLLRATSEQDAGAAVSAALAAGLTYFDTAPQYGGGLAEQRLGQGLRAAMRDAIVVSTKVGKLVRLISGAPAQAVGFIGAPTHEIVYDYSYDGVMRSLEASLARLGIDRVEILLIHDVNRKYHGERVHERLEQAIAGACKALSALRARGVIGAFGTATKDLDIACAFVERSDLDCVMLPARYTLIDQSACDALIPACRRRNVSILAAAPFDSGILATGPIAGATYDYQPASAEILEKVRSIATVCERFGVPLPAAALQFPLRDAAVASVVTGMRSAPEVGRNIELLRYPIPEAFWEAMILNNLLRTDVAH
jgi:D-threo-aldose 1-dehydrogenase